MTTHYDVLGTKESATPEELKRAFQRLALETHPDRHPGDPNATDRFRRLLEAHAVLSNPQMRLDYDSHLGVERAREQTLAEQARDAASRARANAAPAPPKIPTPPAATQPSPNDTGLGELFVKLGVAFTIWAVSDPPRPRRKTRRRRSTRWDPNAGRYRGEDGRFKSG